MNKRRILVSDIEIFQEPKICGGCPRPYFLLPWVLPWVLLCFGTAEFQFSRVISRQNSSTICHQVAHLSSKVRVAKIMDSYFLSCLS